MKPLRRLRLETLENRQLLSVSMTDYEQLMLYYVNRARIDPPAEAARFGIGLNDGLNPGTISSAPKQPLVPNQILRDVAAGHSQDMLDRDYFDHESPEGDDGVDRAQAAGYPTSYVGENISWAGTTGTLDRDAQVASRHESLFRSPVHRTNILHELYQDVGAGIQFGSFTDSGTAYNAALVTQDFGRRNADIYLVGVVYDDSNSNGVYDLREGLANVTIQAGGASTTTSVSGGWFLQVPAGTHQVTASGTGFTGTATSSVTLENQNVEVDFVSGQSWGIVNFVNEAPPAPTDLGTVDYRRLEQLDASQGDLWYQWKTTRSGMLTVQAASDPAGILTLYDESQTELASTGPLGHPRIDVPAEVGETFYLRVSGAANPVDLEIANLIAFAGTEVQVTGTPGADKFEFSAAESYAITINGVDYEIDDSLYETIVFDGGAGDDTATLTGGNGTEVATFFPDHGTFAESKFLVSVNDVTAITAHGGGGADEAYLYDSLGDDTFISHRGYGKLSGPGFSLETFDFVFNYGYATTRNGGTDVALMEDTSGADKFKFDWPGKTQFFGKMYGGGLYYNRAKNFEQTVATMTEGKDTVRLFDSEGDDTFYGQKDTSRMTGVGYDVTVTGYNSLAASASAGNDMAELEDSSDDDTILARPHKTELWGGDDADPTYSITSRKFDQYRFEANHSGFDRAKLHDTVLDDHAEVSGDLTRLYRNNGQMKLLFEATACEWVRLYATPNDDQITNRNTLMKQEPLDFECIYDPLMWEMVP